MRIVLAPDKFKGVDGAHEIAQRIADGIRDVMADAHIELAPVADGGEGTAEIIRSAAGGVWRGCTAHDAWGRCVQARYAWMNDRALAVMEMSEVAGLQLCPARPGAIETATTLGVGEMIADAVEAGAREIIVGVGGSGTNDGGAGMARALGYRFLDENGSDLPELPRDLVRLARIDGSGVMNFAKRTREGSDRVRIIAAVDVRNPLLGADGATHVFARQKGASTAEELERLERCLQRLARVVRRDLSQDHENEPGAGAGGGLGFGLMAFCGAELRTGFEVVAEAIHLRERIAHADVVVTGEGSLDRQTLQGKAPAEVARLARGLGKRVVAVVGKTDGDARLNEVFDRIYTVANPDVSDEENIAHAAELLREGGRRLARDWIR